jgi:6-phosphogluconolactonase (cycloisomerase 2 family)
LTDGKTPHNFPIEPSGRFLLAANQNLDSIVVFHIDEKSGKLNPDKKYGACFVARLSRIDSAFCGLKSPQI